MYDPVALDLSYANQSLPRHYESEEEDISESEGHFHNRSATLDSITSVSDSELVDLDRPALPRLLSPFSANDKPSRPVSMDTVKRSSSATFVTEPCTIFDHDDDMILQLPSPDSTTPLQSPIFLQPAAYVPSEPLTSPRNSFRSSTSASIHSDDDSDVFVAEQVTYVEHAKPNLILISPSATEQSSLSPGDLASPSSDGSIYSNDEAAHSQPVLGETSMDRGRSRYYPVHGKTQGSLSALDTLQKCSARESSSREPMSAPAVEARRLSFRARSMSFSRPQTPVTDRRRLQKEPPRRPPSAQSAATTATFSLFPTQSQTRPHSRNDEDARTRSTSLSYSHSAASSTYSLTSSQPPSRTASPTPYYNPYNRSRSGSLYSVASTTNGTSTTATGKRSQLPYRASIMKSSTFSGNLGHLGHGHGYSSSNLRAELRNGAKSGSGSVGEHDPHSFQERDQTQIDDSKSKTRRKKSMKQLKPTHSSKDSESSAKSFVGFMLRGKRKSVIKSPNV